MQSDATRGGFLSSSTEIYDGLWMCWGFYETHTFVAKFSSPMSTLVFDQSRLDACRRRNNRVSFGDPS